MKLGQSQIKLSAVDQILDIIVDPESFDWPVGDKGMNNPMVPREDGEIGEYG